MTGQTLLDYRLPDGHAHTVMGCQVLSGMDVWYDTALIPHPELVVVVGGGVYWYFSLSFLHCCSFEVSRILNIHPGKLLQGRGPQICGSLAQSWQHVCARHPGPPAGLIAQRINVYRGTGTGGYRPAADQSQAAERDEAVRSPACWRHCLTFMRIQIKLNCIF